MKTVATTLTGYTHEKKNIECQDAVKTYSCDTFSIISLSDGAGSKPFAFESADLATTETINYFKLFLARHSINEFDSSKFIDYIQKSFQAKNYTTENAGATLIFAVTVGNNYLIGHMGDGVAIIENSDVFSVISYPENGEYLNQTFFFPSEAPYEHFRVTTGKLGESAAIIITSDGISDCLYDHKTGDVANAVRLMVNWTRDYTERKCIDVLQNNLKIVFSEYSADDKSIAIVCTE